MDTKVQTRAVEKIAIAVASCGVLALGIFMVSRLQPQPTVNKTAASVIVEPNQLLPTTPHAFDVYRASAANKAIVFLHGGGGTKEHSAYQLGLKSTDDSANYAVANEDLLIDNTVIAVFPQGQTFRAGSPATWSNYVMTSGEDDMQFLRDLVSYIKSHYHVTKVFLAGHSNGGMMASRVWCEEPELFDAFIAIAGPPSEHFLKHVTPCDPSEIKPILSVVGSQDTVLQDSDWGAQKWTINPILTAGRAFIDPVLIGSWFFLNLQTVHGCGKVVSAGDAATTTPSTTTSWSYCNGMIKLVRVESAEHMVESLQAVSGQSMLQFALDFATSFLPAQQQNTNSKILPTVE